MFIPWSFYSYPLFAF